MPRHASFLSALLLSTASALAACAGSSATTPAGGDTTPKPTLGSGDVANGEKLYAELGCKGCHGAAGEKDGVGPNLFAITWDAHEREEAREMILEGDADHKPPMPSFKGKIDDAGIADILAYVAKK
jgi:mono/diheme cytochrome c family protein